MTMSTEPHIARAFDRDLEAIQAMIMKMGGLVEAAILDAAQALETRDDELAEKVRRGDPPSTRWKTTSTPNAPASSRCAPPPRPTCARC
jgi:hypothetical protein